MASPACPNSSDRRGGCRMRDSGLAARSRRVRAVRAPFRGHDIATCRRSGRSARGCDEEGDLPPAARTVNCGRRGARLPGHSWRADSLPREAGYVEIRLSAGLRMGRRQQRPLAFAWSERDVLLRARILICATGISGAQKRHATSRTRSCATTIAIELEASTAAAGPTVAQSAHDDLPHRISPHQPRRLAARYQRTALLRTGGVNRSVRNSTSAR